MRQTGIIRKVDDLGRVVIPKELREKFNLTEGTPIEFLIGEEKNNQQQLILSFDRQESEEERLAKEVQKLRTSTHITPMENDLLEIVYKSIKSRA